MFIYHSPDLVRENIKGLRPADTFEFTFTLFACPELRVPDSILTVYTSGIMSHLPANETIGIGVIGITGERHHPAVYNLGDHAATVRTIKRTNRFLVECIIRTQALSPVFANVEYEVQVNELVLNTGITIPSFGHKKADVIFMLLPALSPFCISKQS